MRIAATHGEMPVHVARPESHGPWPGVVVIHDALGMTTDLRAQAGWLAEAGFLAAAPDLFYWGSRPRCLFSLIQQAVKKEGSVFEDIETVRKMLLADAECNGRVGVIGFCMGGGFAVLLSVERGFGASSVNYGTVPRNTVDFLSNACPVVGSFGAKDRSTRSHAHRLTEALEINGIDHDIEIYDDTGHGFMNDHSDDDVPKWAVISDAISGTHTEYHEASTLDARNRIVAFFNKHLRP